jgi:hypothetical protein
MPPTINITQLVSEFGSWIGKNQSYIKTLLLQDTVSEKFMTHIIQDDDYRASKAVIDDIVQGFQQGWTPKGTAAFTPISTVHRRHKFDIDLTPDDVVGSWLGFLVTENVERSQWPITRYILEKLIMPKIAENRELKIIANGVYAAPVDGVAQDTGLSMDGFCTIIQNKYNAGTSKVNFIGLGTFTHLDIFNQIEAFADNMKEVYQSVPMNIYMSRKWFRAYLRRKRDLLGIDPTYKGMEDHMIDGTNLTLVPLPSMAGQDMIFATPQENFIKLTKVNDGPSTLRIESIKRVISIFADWHEAVGFAVEEAIFASISGDEKSASF